MIYLCNSEGLIVASVPSAVNQGSVGVNEIVLIAPFPETCTVSLTIKLPNGVLLQPYLAEQADNELVMAVVDAFKQRIPGYNVWTKKLTGPITSVSGTALITFLITGEDGTVATPSTQININRTVPYIPNVNSEDINTIAQYLTAANNAAQAAEDIAEAAEVALNTKIEDFENNNFFNAIANEEDPEFDGDVETFLSNASGNVLIKNCSSLLSNLTIPADINTIVFFNCAGQFSECHVVGDSNAKQTISILSPQSGTDFYISDFYNVLNSTAYRISSCQQVINCDAMDVVGCQRVINCKVLGEVSNCDYVEGVFGTPQSLNNNWINYYSCPALSPNTGVQGLDGAIYDLITGIGSSISGSRLTINLRTETGDTAASTNIDLPLTSTFKYKGSVQSFSNLPSGAAVGDVYNVATAYTDPETDNIYPPGTNYAWDGNRWDALGGSITAELVNPIIEEFLNDNPIYTPTITVTQITNGHRVTISDKTGSTSFDVMNGHTPVKGVDYWTAADIAEIKSYVDDAILGGEW